MIVAIHAYENIHGGFCGVEFYSVIEVPDMETAENIACDESLELMQSYDSIIESFENEAEEEGLERDSDEYNNFIEESLQENIVYEIWEVTKNLKSITELDEELWRDLERFLDTHCEIRE